MHQIHYQETAGEVIIGQEQEYLKDLDKILKCVNVGGGTMSVSDFVVSCQ